MNVSRIFSQVSSVFNQNPRAAAALGAACAVTKMIASIYFCDKVTHEGKTFMKKSTEKGMSLTFYAVPALLFPLAIGSRILFFEFLFGSSMTDYYINRRFSPTAIDDHTFEKYKNAAS